MKCIISGHRLHKLKTYNIDWIRKAIEDAVLEINPSIGISGMAGGVDLIFCETLINLNIPYYAYVPFKEQGDLYPEEKESRDKCLKFAKEIFYAKNSKMVEDANCGIVVFDGNKGGTHNVFQQMLEKRKSMIWINPISECIWDLSQPKTF